MMVSKLKSCQRGGSLKENKSTEDALLYPSARPKIQCHLLHMNIHHLNDISRQQSVFKISIISNHILKDFEIYLSFLGALAMDIAFRLPLKICIKRRQIVLIGFKYTLDKISFYLSDLPIIQYWEHKTMNMHQKKFKRFTGLVKFMRVRSPFRYFGSNCRKTG